MSTTEETLGITFPVKTWQDLFALARKSDRLPSDYLRQLINREMDQLMGNNKTPAPAEPNTEAIFAARKVTA